VKIAKIVANSGPSALSGKSDTKKSAVNDRWPRIGTDSSSAGTRIISARRLFAVSVA
jgi:hypothetical protein